MATHVRIKTDSDYLVHIDTHKNNYTLCGLEIAGDKRFEIMPSELVPNKRVNCPICIEIIEFCKAINRYEYI